MTAAAPGEIYFRRASGLTRKLSPMDALIYGIVAPGPTSGLMYITWAPGLYPNANLFWGSFCILMFLPIMGVYYLFSISMPRSGGEYVYVSRTLNPPLGMFANFALTIIGISWTGELSAWFTQYGLGPLFWNWGVVNGDKGLMALGVNFQTPTWGWGVLAGLCALAFSEFVLWRGSKFSMKMFMIGMAATLICGACITIACLSSTAAFSLARIAQFNQINLQSQIIQPAVNMNVGWSPAAPFALGATLAAGSSYILLNLLGNTYTTNIAGEIKNVGRAQPLSLFGSPIFFLGWWFILTWALYNNPGANFMNASSLLTDAGTSPLIIAPWPHQLVLYMTTNPVLINLADLTFCVGIWSCGTALSLGPIRSIFAWSFDRVIPEAFAKVDKRGSPWGACALAACLSTMFYLLYLYTTYLNFILFTVTLWFCAWVVVGIAGIAFPYVKSTKAIFEKAPSQVKAKLAGIPIISILGVMTTIISAYVVYACTIPGIVGLTSLSELATTVITLGVVPFVIYAIAHIYRTRKGVNMALQFTTLPPE
jgi:amino acid transporter